MYPLPACICTRRWRENVKIFMHVFEATAWEAKSKIDAHSSRLHRNTVHRQVVSMSAPSETKIAPLVVDLPLAEVFHSASVLLQGLKKSSHASSSKQYQELLQKTFDMFSSVQERVQGAGVFSSNEELEDVTTASLKYLAVPFYLADMLYLFTGMEGRMQRLQKAKVCMCICMWDKTMRHLCIYIYIYIHAYLLKYRDTWMGF
jgi:hypothetical protein